MRERPDVMNKASRFQGVTKVKVAKAKHWEARIVVTDDGKPKRIHIATTPHLQKYPARGELPGAQPPWRAAKGREGNLGDFRPRSPGLQPGRR